MRNLIILILALYLISACQSPAISRQSAQSQASGIEDDRQKILVFISSKKFNDDEFVMAKNEFSGNDYRVETVSESKEMVMGMFGMKFFPEHNIDDVVITDYEALMVIGGLGIKGQDKRIDGLVQEAYKNGLVIGAVSESPNILARSGILKDKNATIYHSDTNLLEDYGARYVNKDVVVDGKIITGSNPNSAKELAREIIILIGG